jgi:hypothetical protein
MVAERATNNAPCVSLHMESFLTWRHSVTQLSPGSGDVENVKECIYAYGSNVLPG